MRAISGMGLSLLDDGCEGLVQLSHTGLGLGGIPRLEGLLEGSAKDGLQRILVRPYFSSMCMPVTKNVTSNPASTAAKPNGSILPKSARVPVTKRRDRDAMISCTDPSIPEAN